MWWHKVEAERERSVRCACHAQANDESGLSGSLNLGHYGVTQSNSFESVNVGGQGAELVTPFAKLQVPYKVCFC